MRAIARPICGFRSAPSHPVCAAGSYRPRLLTFAEAVAEIAQASGRPIRHVPISPEQFASALADAGLPADFARSLTDVFTEVLDGRNASLADGVQRALGRPARDFSAYARDAAAAGAWCER